MKRLVLRLIIFSVVAVMGVIGIAQARHGLPGADAHAQPEEKVAATDIPAGEPRPLEVNGNARPLSSDDENPLREENRIPALPDSLGRLPHTRAIPSGSGDIPASGVALGRRQVEVPPGKLPPRRQMTQDAEALAERNAGSLHGDHSAGSHEHAVEDDPHPSLEARYGRDPASSQRAADTNPQGEHAPQRFATPTATAQISGPLAMAPRLENPSRPAQGSERAMADHRFQQAGYESRAGTTPDVEAAAFGLRSARRPRGTPQEADDDDQDGPRSVLTGSSRRGEDADLRPTAPGREYRQPSEQREPGYLPDANPLRGTRKAPSLAAPEQQDAGPLRDRGGLARSTNRAGTADSSEVGRSTADSNRAPRQIPTVSQDDYRTAPRGDYRTAEPGTPTRMDSASEPNDSGDYRAADYGSSDNRIGDNGSGDYGEQEQGDGRPGAQKLEGAQSPALTMQKFAPAEIQVGKQCTFEIAVRNVGQVEARAVQIHDVVPKGTTLVSTDPRAEVAEGGKLVWDLGTLASGAESRVSVTLLPVSEGEIGSVATLYFAAQASARTVATKPELLLQLSAAPQVMIGDEVTLNIKLSNPGSGAATGVMLLESVPPQLSHPAGRSLEFEVGTLAAGESRELSLSLTAAEAGHVNNVLIAQADANLQVEGSVEFEVVAPQLSVGLDGPSRRYLERPATYVMSIQNPGTASARNVELVSYLPQGMKFVKANNAGTYDPTSHRVIWGLEELPAKQGGNVELVVIPEEIGDHEIRVTAKADQGLADDTQQQLAVEGLAAILFEVADVNDPVELGGETVYEVRVVNQGSKASTNLQVVALLPPGMRAIAADGPTRPSIDEGRVLFAPLANLSPKADTVYEIKVQAVGRGDQRIRVQVLTDEMQTPVTKEESTRVYDDQ